MSDSVIKVIADLTNASGISGHEAPARAVMEEQIAPYADEVAVDNLGSLIARKGSEGPRILFAGHLDEIGFMVSRITDDGFIKFQPIGGWWSQVVSAQRVKVITRKGELVGIVGSRPPHTMRDEERDKPVKIKDLYIDIGAQSKEEAEGFGVRPGDAIVPDSQFTPLANPKMLLAKAVDNRIGCAAVVEVFKRLQGQAHPNIVFGAGTVQEEVGLRGARTSAYMVEPDIAFAIDTGLAADTPGFNQDDATGKLGGGPQIIVYDASMVPHKGLRDFVIDTAEEIGIPYQFSTLAFGGTDAGSFHLYGRGVPSLFIGVPTRYIHTHASVFHQDDYENTVKLLLKLVEKLDANTVEQIKKSS
jgi:endoglucanase